jgi:hypothetical protein
VHEFFKKYSYSAVKLFVSQIAISIFGLVLVIACAKIGKTMQIASSFGAVAFYLFLIYTSMWEVGYKDKFGIEYGKFNENPLTGLFVGLLANSLNIILALVITLCLAFPDGGVLSTIGGLCSSGALFIEGMYTGLLTISIGETPLNSFGISYFVITLPAIAASAIAYLMGTKGIHFTKLLLPETPEEAEIRREKKSAKRKDNEE